MRVVITGAAGRIGNQVVNELASPHELRLIDKRPLRSPHSVVADLSSRSLDARWPSWLKRVDWRSEFSGVDVAIHLAAEMQPIAPWEKVLANNIEATWNVLEAAAAYRVRRIVFASSNWAVKASEQKMAPDCYRPDGRKIGSEAMPSPLTAYGLSKAFGEVAGRMFVDEGKIESFLAVRIGSYDPVAPADPVLCARWIGVHDLRSLFRRSVEADFKGFHVVYGVSAQETVPYDLLHTRELLSWAPEQLPGNFWTENGRRD